MWITTHATVGAAIGHHLHASPLFIAFNALLSHAVLDVVPHWDYGEVKHPQLWAVYDLILAITIVQSISAHTHNTQTMILGALMGVIPDVEVALRYLGLLKQTYFPSHRPWFPHGKASPKIGMLLQGISLILSVCLVVFFK